MIVIFEEKKKEEKVVVVEKDRRDRVQFMRVAIPPSSITLSVISKKFLKIFDRPKCRVILRRRGPVERVSGGSR